MTNYRRPIARSERHANHNAVHPKGPLTYRNCRDFWGRSRQCQLTSAMRWSSSTGTNLSCMPWTSSMGTVSSAWYTSSPSGQYWPCIMARSTKDDTLKALLSFSNCFSLEPCRAKPALGSRGAGGDLAEINMALETRGFNQRMPGTWLGVLLTYIHVFFLTSVWLCMYVYTTAWTLLLDTLDFSIVSVVNLNKFSIDQRAFFSRLGLRCGQSYLRKLQASRGERHRSTQVGRLKIEQRLGSKAVGPPPLIITILWISSGYSWARNVQKDTLWRKAGQDSRIHAKVVTRKLTRSGCKQIAFLKKCTNSCTNNCYWKTY